MKKKEKKTKLKKDRSINSVFEEHVKGTSEVESRVKVKETVIAPSPYETESDSDSASLSDETKSGNVCLGLPSKTVNVSRNRSRNHTLDFGKWSRGTLSYHIQRKGWSDMVKFFFTNLKDIAGIPNRETLLITYKLHDTNILLRETTFEAFCFHMVTAEGTIHFLNATTGQSTPSSSFTKLKQPPKPLQVQQISTCDVANENILKKTIEGKEWDNTFIACLSKELREIALRAFLKKLLVNKHCRETNKTTKVGTIVIGNPEGLEKKTRSLLTADEIQNFLNKRSKVRAIYGTRTFLLNPLMAQCPICMSLVSLGHFNDIVIKDDKLKLHIDSAHHKDPRNATSKGKIIIITY